MKKLKVEVDPKGTVNLEFSGFKGEECTEERERLRRALLDLGVMLETEKIEKKSPEQLASEITATKDKQARLGHETY